MLQVTNLFQIFCDWLQLFLTKKEEAQLFTRCSLLVEIHSLLVARCKITCYSLQNSLVIRCTSCLLQKITRYSLQKLLVAKNHSLLVAKFARYSLQKITRYSLQNSLVARCRGGVTL